jgi:hypothetical protein
MMRKVVSTIGYHKRIANSIYPRKKGAEENASLRAALSISSASEYSWVASEALPLAGSAHLAV